MAFVRSLKFKLLIIALFVLLSINGGFYFYTPGGVPQAFHAGDLLKVKVNSLTSTKNQIPYSYYTLPYCRPNKTVLDDDDISPYVFNMQEAQKCNIVCRILLDAKSAEEISAKIEDEYRVNMQLDNLPLVVLLQRFDDEPAPLIQLGYPVGIKGWYANSTKTNYYLMNHLSFTIKYDRDFETNSARIFSFDVQPFSVKHRYKGKWNEKSQLTTCHPHEEYTTNEDYNNGPQEVADGSEIIFTYEVLFWFKHLGPSHNFQPLLTNSLCLWFIVIQESTFVKSDSRWNLYITTINEPINLFSIVIAMMTVVFLSVMVLMILLRALSRDLSRYNELETQEDAQEESGWKLVHSDVFRPPTHSDLLCAHVGAGVQFFMVVLIITILALLGFITPLNQSWVMTTMLLLWIFMAFFAGYSSARLYKMFNGTDWKKNAFKTAVMFPSLLFSFLFPVNVLISPLGITGAVLVLLWFGASVPLVYIGSYIGFVKKNVIENPVKFYKIPREIPDRVFYMEPIVTILIGGILPFGVIFTQIDFIMISVWFNLFYNSFCFLWFAFIALIVSCMDISIILCYFQLCGEDYRWWWRSFLTTGSSALYFCIYATFFFFSKLEITKPGSVMFYFGYMLIASYVFFVLTGTVGFYACFWFTRLIYSSLKID